jgi:hypothetical protein
MVEAEKSPWVAVAATALAKGDEEFDESILPVLGEEWIDVVGAGSSLGHTMLVKVPLARTARQLIAEAIAGAKLEYVCVVNERAGP